MKKLFLIILLVIAVMFTAGSFTANPDQMAFAANPVLTFLESIILPLLESIQSIVSGTDQKVSDNAVILDDIEQRLISIEAALVPPPAVCGNDVLESGEVCDDGNNVNDDSCSADCLSTLECGNGIADPGEVCDDGNNVNGDACSADCLSVEICGNFIVDVVTGESCDDGNITDDGNGCSSICKLNSICGNGILEDLVEECDDGNNVNGDGCSSVCTVELPVCDDTNACTNDSFVNGVGCIFTPIPGLDCDGGTCNLEGVCE